MRVAHNSHTTDKPIALEFPIKLELLILVEGGKLENPEKNSLGARTRTNNKLNLLMTPGPGFESAPHWWEVSIITAAPPLLPSFPLFSGLLFLETL